LSRLYASPLRVYVLLSGLALFGIFSGFRLPISLFPNSSKPEIYVNIPYGGSTPEEFLNLYGKILESELRSIKADNVEVESLRATYNADGATYRLFFKWGVAPNAAHRETLFVVNSFITRLNTESRDNVDIWLNGDNNGFLAVSFFSETRDLDELYDLLEPILIPRVAHVKDTFEPSLWNPSAKEIRVDLYPSAMAAFKLFPKDVEHAVTDAMAGRTGGSVTIGTKEYEIEMPRQVRVVSDFSNVVVPTTHGNSVHLSEVAHVEMGPKTNDSKSFKTNGAPSLILFASPRPGGNVKKMSEDILAVVESIKPLLPADVQHRVLVDPSQFIRSAINNVLSEVVIAAMLAVIVLFFFIGSFKNVITAAIEIPLSMVLAFILMRISGMNLNLISLGGLALSAGMNVDASVVVMENIFRHFEMHPGPHDAKTRLKILMEAVHEVKFAVIASTIASLVVFLPLTFTSALSYAILGDLAKAVVFSHGFSALVALVLVPTVRLQLMSLSQEKPHRSPIENQLKRLEEFYAFVLGKFMDLGKMKWGVYSLIGGLLAVLIFLVLPRLPKEILGTPDTDWMNLTITAQGNTLLRQMELKTEEIERDLLQTFGDSISYTFSQNRDPNRSSIMARLKSQRDMHRIWKAMEQHFTNTPFIKFSVNPWNPSEMPIPDPPHLRVAVRGNDTNARASVAQQLSSLLNEQKVFPRVWTEPDANFSRGIRIVPHYEQWAEMAKSNSALVTSAEIADVANVATNGRRIGKFPVKNRPTDVYLHYSAYSASNFEDLTSLPIGIGTKIVPLRALAEMSIEQSPFNIYREDEREVVLVLGREDVGEKARIPASVEKAKRLIHEWEIEHLKVGMANGTSILFEDAAKDLNDAISELTVAIGVSILLIFLTLVIQFGSFAEPLLVLVSIPLGFIGVISSLFVFRSTLSLNSILGVILLNGIAVANSIILVDFIKRMVASGKSPREAALEAARKRLRPILITSLTTVLGMLPVATGLGEGGRVLQPLGIAVSGGLGISMSLTLLLVPALQVSLLEWRLRRVSLSEKLRRILGTRPAPTFSGEGV
jgi:HAE1 family hydrophobic/amphiphilic exporter-1